MLIDTHCHLDFPDFHDDLDLVIKNATQAGVKKLISIGTSLQTSRNAVNLSEKYHSVFSTVGIHPCDVTNSSLDDITHLKVLIDQHKKVVAVGECGLDYHKIEERNPSTDIKALKKKQKELFEAQLDLAHRENLNVVIHQRDSWNDLWEILSPYSGKLNAVYHCFGGSIEQASQIIDHGFLLSFTGIVTFKNAKEVHKTISEIPDHTFMIETDCPYLAPTPHRGKRNEPAYTSLIANRIAELRNTTPETIISQTGNTAHHFFKHL